MLAPARRGAHPEAWLVPPSAALVDGWSADNGVVLAMLAPELPGALDVIAALVDRKVVVALGHTDAPADDFAAGLAAGATYVTHLFNAMRPFAHRDPGPIGAALATTAPLSASSATVSTSTRWRCGWRGGPLDPAG